MNFQQFFQKLWFTSKEAEIFLTLYKLGTKPASTIAKHLNMERTNVYKTLLRMTQENIVSETMVGGVKQFFVPDVSVLRKYMTNKVEQLQKLDDNFAAIETELSQYDKNKYTSVPKISIFDGMDGVRNLYTDIYDTAVANKYFVIKFFASNTFESQINVNTTIKDYYQDIFAKLQKKKVTIDAYLGNGILIMEQITKTTNIQNLNQLPAGNSAINIFVVGKCVYIVIYKDVPFGLKLESEDLANVMHFLFEKLKVE